MTINSCYTQLQEWEGDGDGDRGGWRAVLEHCHAERNKMQKGFSLFSSSTSFLSLSLTTAKVRNEDQDVQKYLGNLSNTD